jgi:hypothetical protein
MEHFRARSELLQQRSCRVASESYVVATFWKATRQLHNDAFFSTAGPHGIRQEYALVG